jgi:DNA invertase Pin-like site-specific DNA recombinase
MAKTKKNMFSSQSNLPTQNFAVCYMRVSTEEQAVLGVSLDAQEERLKAYCLMSNLQIVKMIREEGVSGAKDLATRPGGKDMLELIQKKKVTNIVALKLDRLFRDTANALQETSSWDKAGVALHLVDLGGQSLNTSSAMGKFFITMMAGIAELERNLIGERTSSALQHMKSQKDVYSTTPFGFDRQTPPGGNPSGEDDILIPNKSEQHTILKINKWRYQGWSLRKIANELTIKGVATKQGGKWYASTVKYLLDNDLYNDN